jgi:hypothetical protein
VMVPGWQGLEGVQTLLCRCQRAVLEFSRADTKPPGVLPPVQFYPNREIDAVLLPFDLSPSVPRIQAGSFFVLSCILTSQCPQLITIARFGIGYKEKPDCSRIFQTRCNRPSVRCITSAIYAKSQRLTHSSVR